MKKVFENVQQKFLLLVKSKLPPNISFVESLAEDLSISTDSAYRRLRGDTELSFKELKLLCTKYDVSLDGLLSGSNSTVPFQFRAIDHKTFHFDDFLLSLQHNLATMKGFKARELIYSAKDIPIFYFFIHPRLAAFKIFFWKKYILNFPEYKDSRFSHREISRETVALAQSIWEQYIDIQSLEIWSGDTIRITLKQIEYCRTAGLFHDEEEWAMLLNELRSIVSLVERMAEKGHKLAGLKEQGAQRAAFQLYYNDLYLNENMVFFKMDDLCVAHINFNVLNILTTTDPAFCTHAQHVLDGLKGRAQAFDRENTDLREAFFSNMYKQIERLQLQQR
jgi:hypothetical protein